uniref:Uncharacterized protein n=1 Tax=Arundo donax TaxID=35708 RepID=A0A0A9C252_ARUDO
MWIVERSSQHLIALHKKGMINKLANSSMDRIKTHGGVISTCFKIIKKQTIFLYEK